MKQTTKLMVLLVAIFTLTFNSSYGQLQKAGQGYMSQTFNPDSLAGFDEEAAKASAFQEGFLGPEFPVRMATLKRFYINDKYNLWPKIKAAEMKVYNKVVSSFVVNPACVNEDFEASTPAQITSSNQIAGWNVLGGSVLGTNACNVVISGAPLESELINCPPGGYIDPVIGGVYPIYSVFGNGANSGNGINPQIAVPMGGSKIIRINDNVNDYSAVQLSKAFNVSPSNAVFQFAFISVFSTGHTCCEAGSFRIKISAINPPASPTVLACPNFSVAAPSTQCTTVTPMPYYIPVTGAPFTGSGAYVFSKWFLNSLDLTAYLGQTIQLDLIVTDCNAGGHYGYTYFDSQCLPMNIIGNGQGFPAGTPSITLPTCGAAGATVTAPPGLGPYSWSSGAIGIPPNLTVPSQTNNILVTNQSGTVQLTMNPPGSCAPIIKVITVSVTPAPIVVASAMQTGCTNTLSAASITCAGSASVNPTISWNPMPGSIANNSLSATGLPVGITTITVQDPLGCVATATVNILPTPPPVTFTINNATGSPSITCIFPSINLQALSNYTYGTISYTWSSPSFTANTPTVNISAANTLTLYGMDPATGCLYTQTVTIGVFTTQPTNSVAPTSQAITCNSGAPVTFSGTVTNPTINIQHDWYSPLNPLPGGVPIATSNNTISILTGAIPPGTYTLVTTNLVNGCQSFKTVTVTSLNAFPTYSLNSPTNFSVGCSPLNQTTISIINPVSTQTPPATCSYTFLAPSFTGAVTPSVVLGGNTSTITTIPGTWTIIVQDNSNFCRTQISVPIIQNTVAPNVSATILQQTLTCYHPTLIATGVSTTSNTIIEWNVPATPPLLSTPTVEVGPANGPNTSTTSLTYANYTVIATNTLNACQSTSVVVIAQNFKQPISSPTISVGTPTAIYCTVSTAPVVLTTGSSTTTSGGGPTAFVVNPFWQGPSPQGTITGVSSYSAYVPGIYSLTVQDNYNGCIATGTINVLDKTQPPVLRFPLDTATLDCGNSRATLNFVLTGTTSGMRYLVNEYPTGASFSPTNSISYNLNPILSGTSSNSVQVSKLGHYEYVVTNTLTGCSARGEYYVKGGGLTAEISPNVVSGYAPLTVAFDNLSTSSLGTSSINSIWSFGNGSVETNSTGASTSATYDTPGSYTVTLLVTKGACVDTTYKIIKVEIPSKLEVPNVFTPNGDGNNDVFFLKSANLGEITAVIFDRWGNKVYDVTSSSGNIAWDGKNQSGKECPGGVYFYVIKATGKDNKPYDTKGNVTIFR